MQNGISLLPPELRIKQKRNKTVFYYVTAAVTVLAVFLLVYFALLISNAGLDSNLKQIQWENTVLKKQMGDYQVIESMQTKINAGVTALKSAYGISADWTGMLKEISYKIPADIWLIEIIGTYSADKKVMDMKGYALSQDRVGILLAKLTSLKTVSNVKLISSTVAQTVDINYYQFEITADILSDDDFDLLMEAGVN